MEDPSYPGSPEPLDAIIPGILPANELERFG